MFGPRRGSSVAGLVIFIILWLVALAFVFLGHDRLTGLSDDSKKRSLQAELEQKKFDPEKEQENISALFHERDTLRKEVTYLGRMLGYGLDQGQEMDDATFTAALQKATGKLNDFRAASTPGLPKFEEKNKRPSVPELYDEDMGRGINFFAKFDILLGLLVGRLVRYEDMVAYYKDLRAIAEEVTTRSARVAPAIEGGITRAHPDGDGEHEYPGKRKFIEFIDQEKAEIEKMFLIDRSKVGNARSIEDAETRAVNQMTEYVISTVNNKIGEYEQMITQEEEKIDVAAQAFKTERNALGTSIKNVVKERHRGRDIEGAIRVLPPIAVSGRDPSEQAPSVDDDAPDGEIVVVSPDTNEAYINVGRDEGIVEGMSFLIYRRGPQRHWLYKGEVQVKQVLPRMSVVSLTDEVSRFDPISAGDGVFNKVYNAADPVRIVFLGELSEADGKRYRHLIERIGGVVDDEVTVLTDFVILLADHERHAGSKDNIDRAKEIGVKGMTLEELRVYIDY